ncbi:hypothetical protein FRB96_002764 [Tulasnella sp. 330]|nr:hypothetical protein FRB96_002764 [Tulasnella sp. 330]KAG8872093.1 hypothetical protein FRB97_008031 [Tulasnella sp. 331]KAG8879580.1 hypothetical protein FRB98_005608 [Tulasnella sp. 332]
MPFVTILNETDSDLHIAMLAGVPCHFDNNVPPGGRFRAGVTSTPWGYEARIPRPGNEFSSEESWSRAGVLAGGVAAGTASVIVGSMWALRSLGGWFSPPGQVAVRTAGNLWNGANAAFAQGADGAVLRKDWWMVGFADVTYAIRVVDGRYDLVEV